MVLITAGLQTLNKLLIIVPKNHTVDGPVIRSGSTVSDGPNIDQCVKYLRKNQLMPDCSLSHLVEIGTLAYDCISTCSNCTTSMDQPDLPFIYNGPTAFSVMKAL